MRGVPVTTGRGRHQVPSLLTPESCSCPSCWAGARGFQLPTWSPLTVMVAVAIWQGPGRWGFFPACGKGTQRSLGHVDKRCSLRSAGERDTVVGPAPACSWGLGGKSKALPISFLGPKVLSLPSPHPHSLSMNSFQGLQLHLPGRVGKVCLVQIPGSGPYPPGWHLLLCALERGA